MTRRDAFTVPGGVRATLGTVASAAGETTARRFFVGLDVPDAERVSLTAVQLAMLCATAAHLALTQYQERQAKESATIGDTCGDRLSDGSLS